MKIFLEKNLAEENYKLFSFEIEKLWKKWWMEISLFNYMLIVQTKERR